MNEYKPSINAIPLFNFKKNAATRKKTKGPCWIGVQWELSHTHCTAEPNMSNSHLSIMEPEPLDIASTANRAERPVNLQASYCSGYNS